MIFRNFHSVSHSVEIHKFLSHDFSAKEIKKIRQINLVKELYSKMTLQILSPMHLPIFAQIRAKIALVKVEE